MDELKMLENDFITLFESYSDELSKDMRDKLIKSTIGNFFDYLRRQLEISMVK